MHGSVAPNVGKPCEGRDEIFLAPNNELADPRREREAQAKALCAECTVRDLCLEVAIANREAGAIWGGMNDEERAELARELARRAP